MTGVGMKQDFNEDFNPWTQLKDLEALVGAALVRHLPGLQPELERALQRNRSKFIDILKNPVRSSVDADLVKKASTEGIRLQSGETSIMQRLPNQMVEEAFILSDMFQINEIAALHLLLQAEEQLCQYPGLTRGLVSVLLYYDSQRCLVQALRTLIQSRFGVTWTFGASPEITEYVTNYTDDLLKHGLVDKVLNLLSDMDWSKESMNLQKNLALGDAKHRKLVQSLYDEVKKGLSDCIFSFAAQSGLPKDCTLRLIDHLAKIKHSESGPQGQLDEVHLDLTMALLYAVNVSAINKEQHSDDVMQTLPILRDPTFIPTIHQEFEPSKKWQHPAIQSVSQFAWSLTLATLRSSTLQLSCPQSILEEDETILSAALENGLFHCLPFCILTKKTLVQEEFYYRRIHQLLTDLIILMPLKVKELRNRADEGARNKLMHENEGVMYTMPLAGQHLEHLLNTIATLYGKNDLGLSLMLEYWCPPSGEMSERYPINQVALNKFIRLTGDLLMPSLFKPYIEMLVSLSSHPQASLHCFNMLKTNGGSSSLSWDHFFGSLHQYFTNLRQESQISSVDTIYRVAGRQMTRGISPAEVHGLVSVLRLIASVCSHSEVARIAIAENPNWQPILVFVGLLSCSVPAILKAEIMKVLSALAKTPEIAQVIWQSLESSQLIVPQQTTIGSSFMGHSQHFGLLNELQETECRNEEYPMSTAFLDLLRVLLHDRRLSVPANVNINPYVTFVRDEIFLKFHARAYKRPEERWEVGTIALKILHSLIEDYNVSEQDFDEKQGKKQPGFHIMTDLLQMSEVLRQLLYILDDGCSLLDKYNDFHGKEQLENTCLYVLMILERGLQLQNSILEAARASNYRKLLNPLDKLLLGLNPRSGKPDHMLNIVKFVIFAWWLPKHGLKSVTILRHVSASVSAQPLLLANFTQTDLLANTIIKGFTDMLENETMEEDETGNNICEESRVAVIQLLLQGLSYTSPSLSYFLLGFDLRNISRSTIQQPGVEGAVRSPLHAVISLLRPAESKLPSSTLLSSPVVAESAYKLIFNLAFNNQTSEPILRFLRSSEDFLNQQINVLPLPSDYVSPESIRAISWLLKTVAIELKALSSSRQRSLISRMTFLLLNGRSYGATATVDNQDAELTTRETALSELSSYIQPSVNNQSHVHRLVAILNAIDFQDQAANPPNLGVFDPTQITGVLKNLETSVEGSNARAIDIRALHEVLTANAQGATVGQKQIIEDEIESILSYAVTWNSRQENIMTQKNLLESWRQVTEVLLCGLPHDTLPPSSKQQLLLELLQVLLNKVLSDGALVELANTVSGVVMLLLVSLRQTYIATISGSSQNMGYVAILDSLKGEPFHQPERESRMYPAALQVILKGLVSWIIETSSSAQRSRANLYGALLNYLRIGIEDSTTTDVVRLRKSNLDVLASFGEVFVDVVCRDAVSGHDVRKMLALSLLDTLSSHDGGTGHSGSWLWFMSKQGYLRHIIESLVLEDQRLTKLVASAQIEHIKALYTYESKMALLTRLAATNVGAELLLETGLMLRLAEMGVFSARPESVSGDDGPMARYEQILFPALRLCQALLSSLGTSNRSVTAQVIHFVCANECMVREVLHYKSLFNPSSLKEMALLTGVLARCAWVDINEVVSYSPEVSAKLSAIQRQMFSLITHFGSSESSLKNITSNSESRLLLEGHANAVLFIRNYVGKSGGSRLVFAPSLSEAVRKDDSMNQAKMDHNLAFSNRPPSIGHLVLVLNYLSSHLQECEKTLRDTCEKLASVDVLSATDLAQFLPPNVADKMSSSDRRSVASNKMREEVSRLCDDKKLAGEAVEGGLYLLWTHLNKFLGTSTIGVPDGGWQTTGSTPHDSIEQLQKDSLFCLNDVFFCKIDEVSKINGKRDGYIEGLIRRLKKFSIPRK